MVDIRLYKYIGKRGDGDLKARRKANAKDRHGSSFVDMQVFPYQMVWAFFPSKDRKYQHSGDPLWKDGSVGNAFHTCMENNHKQQIKKDIAKSADYKYV